MTVSSKPASKSFGWSALFNRPAKPYVHPYLGGLILGLVLFLALFLTGNGLGSSGATSRLVTFVQDQIDPAHVDRTPYLLKMAGGDKNPLDDWLVPVFFGALLGGFTSGLIGGRVKLETTKGPHVSDRTRWLLAFLGGVLFLYGARMARGCTSGQALTGGAVLSAGSWTVMLAIFGGAYALAYFVRKLWN
ncbi:MAG: YeeE/YedE family protein [Anaerolineales bacterium]|nr:YeeE/YedE family protein [Anaerolineales bacterium]MCX7754446.1 YeeE/YedE family protein [Anaerolineales bacterium]MDW8276560.1 YeeE/YedE thiosulfate transporter family protein [Anaerolineales bacterium]